MGFFGAVISKGQSLIILLDFLVAFEADLSTNSKLIWMLGSKIMEPNFLGLCLNVK